MTPTRVTPDLTFLTGLFVADTIPELVADTIPELVGEHISTRIDRKEPHRPILRIGFHAGLSLAGAGCGLQIRRRINAQQFDSA